MYLCHDLLESIYQYIEPSWLKNINKDYYSNYIKTEYEVTDTSLRRLIRKDSHFILNDILFNNINVFIKRKKYYYKTVVHKNYVEFLIYYSVANNANKCADIIKNNYGKYLIKTK